MMNLLLLFLLVQTEFKNTEIFRPLQRTNVAWADSGHVFIMNRDECRILMYEADGTLKKTFGGKGEGPGEFQMPFMLVHLDNHLYVTSMQGVTVFDTDGNHIEKIKPEKMGTFLIPTINGWTSMIHHFDRENATRRTDHILMNKEMEQLVLLGSDLEELKFEPGKRVMKFNPAKARATPVVDQTGRFVAFKGKTDFPIAIYQLQPQPKRIADINLSNLEPLPFNKEWGKKKLEEVTERLERRGRSSRMSFTADFPEQFPIVKDIDVSPENDLVIYLWSKDPQKPKMLLYDWDGNQKGTTFFNTPSSRILAIKNGTALVADYDEDMEEYILRTMPREECETYIEGHPYSEEF